MRLVKVHVWFLSKGRLRHLPWRPVAPQPSHNFLRILLSHCMHEIVPRQGQHQKHASCRETSGFLVRTVLGREQVDRCPSTPWMSSHLWSETLPLPDFKSGFRIILCWLTVALTRGLTQKWSKRGKYFGIPLCEKANVVGFKLVCLYIPDAMWVYLNT